MVGTSEAYGEHKIVMVTSEKVKERKTSKKMGKVNDVDRQRQRNKLIEKKEPA